MYTRSAFLYCYIIHQQGLGGVMWWESSSDKKGADSLISTVRVFSFPTSYCGETGGVESNAKNVDSSLTILAVSVH
jgi:GH18 family chitinase